MRNCKLILAHMHGCIDDAELSEWFEAMPRGQRTAVLKALHRVGAVLCDLPHDGSDRGLHAAVLESATRRVLLRRGGDDES